jgi:GPH family glycoside/pentoside/hexuronide:cation symporter
MTSVESKFKIKLSIKTKFAIGGIGFNLSAGMFAAWLMNFYIKVIRIDPLLWGLAWILYIVWNAINDPLIGYFGDRTRTKLGRRMPWLIIATPAISIAYLLLFFPPNLDPSLMSSQWISFFWLLFTLLMYDTFYTVIGIMQQALVTELSILSEERANTGLFWAVGTLLGQVITFIVPFFLIVNEDPYSQNLPIFQFLVVIFTIIGFLTLAVMSFTIKEKKEFMYAEKVKMNFGESIKYTLKNKGFIIYTAFTFMLVYISSAIYSQVSFFVQDVLSVSAENILSSLPIFVFIFASLIGYPIGIYFNKKYGGKTASIYLSLIAIGGLILLTFVSDFISSNILLFLIGIGYAGVMLLAPILMMDLIDEDELQTNFRREGAYFGSTSLFTKPAQSIAAALTGLILVLTDYNQEAVVQSELAKFGIKLNIGLIPAIFLIIGIIILFNFPIDGSTAEYKEMKKRLELLHDKKLESYLNQKIEK